MFKVRFANVTVCENVTCAPRAFIVAPAPLAPRVPPNVVKKELFIVSVPVAGIVSGALNVFVTPPPEEINVPLSVIAPNVREFVPVDAALRVAPVAMLVVPTLKL